MIHTPPRKVASTDLKLELTLADRAAPILRRISTTPEEHKRRDCVSYDIVEPNIENLEALFDTDPTCFQKGWGVQWDTGPPRQKSEPRHL